MATFSQTWRSVTWDNINYAMDISDNFISKVPVSSPDHITDSYTLVRVPILFCTKNVSFNTGHVGLRCVIDLIHFSSRWRELTQED